jgi:hypothetical protein
MEHRIGSIFWLAIGIFAAIHSYRLGLGSFRHPGSGFIFFLSALVMVILSAIDLTGTLIRKPKAQLKEPSVWKDLRWQKVLLVLCGLSVYTFLLNLAGFWIATFLLMIFLFKGVEPTRWLIAVTSSLITVFLSYVVFKVLLLVEFPQGILGF